MRTEEPMTKLTDDRLAELTATKVLKWHKKRIGDMDWWIKENGRRNSFNPCNDANDERLVVEAVKESKHNVRFELSQDKGMLYGCAFEFMNNPNDIFHRVMEIDKKPGRAVCIAALKAEGVDVTKGERS